MLFPAVACSKQASARVLAPPSLGPRQLALASPRTGAWPKPRKKPHLSVGLFSWLRDQDYSAFAHIAASLTRCKHLRELLVIEPRLRRTVLVLADKPRKKDYLSAILFSWLRDQDSNLGPHGYEPCELPLLHPAITNFTLRLV